MSEAPNVEKKLCIGKTKKGEPCKKKASIGQYCGIHANSHPNVAAEDTVEPEVAAVATEEDVVQDEAAAESSKTFDAIVNAGANLVNLLESAIEQVPELMDNVFTLSGSKFMMPALSSKMQERATEMSVAQLRKIQTDLINKGADPEKLDELLKKVSGIEKMVFNVLKLGDSFIPQPLKTEMIRAFSELQSLRLEVGVPGPKEYIEFCKKMLKIN